MDLKGLYNGMVGYLWPEGEKDSGVEPEQKEEMSPIARLKRLRNLMQDSNYSQAYRQQICNFYSRLIKDYPQARSTFKYPPFLYEPTIYKPKICFMVPLLLNYQEVKGAVELFIMLEEELNKNMPIFYIKNPNYEKSKPNKKFVMFAPETQEKKYFQAVMGGVKILMPEISDDRWEWTTGSYYKEENILNMVRWIHKKLLLDCFPFIKRKKEKEDLIYSQSKALKEYLKKTMTPSEEERIVTVPLLQNIQTLSVLQATIQFEHNALYRQLEQLRQTEKQSQLWSIKEFIPVPADKRSELLLEAVSSLSALRDTVLFLQMKLHNNEIEFDQFKKFSEKMFQEEFEEMKKISFLEVPQILW